MDSLTKTEADIDRVCDRIRNLLKAKNRSYGNSVLDPVRIMSKSDAIEGILVRIDDKLSRIKLGSGMVFEDEDVVLDLLGYFILLKIALERNSLECYNTNDSEN